MSMKEFVRDGILHYEGLINSEMAKELRREKALRNVTELVLQDSGLGPEGLKSLTVVRALWEIRKLTLARASLGDKGAKVLAGAEDLQKLEALFLAPVSAVSAISAVSLQPTLVLSPREGERQ